MSRNEDKRQQHVRINYVDWMRKWIIERGDVLEWVDVAIHRPVGVEVIRVTA